MGDTDSGGSYECMGAGTEWEVSVLFAQFGCEPKTELKKKVFFQKTLSFSSFYLTIFCQITGATYGA